LERVFKTKGVWKLAAAIVPKNGKRAWRFNQALMELGALVCSARSPKCPMCPVRSECLSASRFLPVRPATRERRPPSRRLPAAS
jgi:adenine-specific DNA glycosylase